MNWLTNCSFLMSLGAAISDRKYGILISACVSYFIQDQATFGLII